MTAKAKARCEGQVERHRLYPSYQEAVGIDGEAIELEWKIITGFLSLSILQEVEKDLDHLHVNVQRHRLVKRNEC